MVVFILELFLFGCHFHFYFSFNDLISALVMSKLISRLQVIFPQPWNVHFLHRGESVRLGGESRQGS